MRVLWLMSKLVMRVKIVKISILMEGDSEDVSDEKLVTVRKLNLADESNVSNEAKYNSDDLRSDSYTLRMITQKMVILEFLIVSK